MTPPRTLAPALSLALASLGAAAPVAAQLAQVEVHAVHFEGNTTFPRDSLARAIATRPSECRSWLAAPACLVGLDIAQRPYFLSNRELANDRRRLVLWYRQRGFRTAQVDTAIARVSDGAVDVRFLIEEGPPVVVDSLAYTGLEGLGLDVEGILRDLPLRVGDRLSSLALEGVKRTLVTRLTNNGYARAAVYPVTLLPRESPHSARVTFQVEAGPRTRFGEITVDSLGSLSRSTVVRTLPFASGDLYRANLLAEGQRRLFGLGVVQSATVRADLEAPTDTLVPVGVVVREGDVHEVRAGMGWSTAECVDTEARWASRNFRGGGRTLQARARVSNLLARDFWEVICWDAQAGDPPWDALNWLVAVDFAQPWILSTRNALGISVFGERQGLPQVFVRTAVGFELALTRVLGVRTPMRVSYRPQLSTLEAADVLFCTGFLVCDPGDIGILQARNWLAPVGFTITSNETDNLLNPSDGYLATLSLEHAAAWTGSTFRYDRALVEGSWYDRVSDGSVVAARLRGGWVGSGAFLPRLGTQDVGIIHPEKRFYAGGANSVRGFAQGRLGPRVLVLDDVVTLLESSGAGCAPEEVLDQSCDPAPLADGVFQPRPTGGTRVIEGNLEVRFPLGGGFQGVTFADVGQVWGPNESVDLASLEVTPGLGLRVLSPIGPLRMDLAYRFRSGVGLPVVTSQLRPIQGAETGIVVDGVTIPYVVTNELALLDRPNLFGESSALSIRRLQLHLSIGQAF